jgi:hypothetical protein
MSKLKKSKFQYHPRKNLRIQRWRVAGGNTATPMPFSAVSLDKLVRLETALVAEKYGITL